MWLSIQPFTVWWYPRIPSCGCRSSRSGCPSSWNNKMWVEHSYSSTFYPGFISPHSRIGTSNIRGDTSKPLPSGCSYCRCRQAYHHNYNHAWWEHRIILWYSEFLIFIYTDFDKVGQNALHVLIAQKRSSQQQQKEKDRLECLAIVLTAISELSLAGFNN